MRSDRLVQMGVAVALFGVSFTSRGLGLQMSTNQLPIEKGTLQLTSLKAETTVNSPLADQIYIRIHASEQTSWGPYTIKPKEEITLNNIPTIDFVNSCTVELRYVNKNNSQELIGSTRIDLDSSSPSTITGHSATYTLNYEVKKK